MRAGSTSSTCNTAAAQQHGSTAAQQCKHEHKHQHQHSNTHAACRNGPCRNLRTYRLGRLPARPDPPAIKSPPISEIAPDGARKTVQALPPVEMRQPRSVVVFMRRPGHGVGLRRERCPEVQPQSRGLLDHGVA
ncbi:hypothetical protein G7Z17_g8710 [Cylindrodendrum hubeiense]|uniref:Uncharacterized protein n=1 Tax=Cylindrodendrum hubeiense TaxID=595255 RepID=A0A9P5L6A6_9HYPO|nr:hypothetical protein G7Z17_g8710 [Cylindrodendrum hubeiense]